MVNTSDYYSYLSATIICHLSGDSAPQLEQQRTLPLARVVTPLRCIESNQLQLVAKGQHLCAVCGAAVSMQQSMDCVRVGGKNTFEQKRITNRHQY